MKKIISGMAAVTFALSSVSATAHGAQSTLNSLDGGYETPLTKSSEAVYAACNASAAQNTPGFDATQACACVVGYMGASLADRDFVLFGMLSQLGLADANGASMAEKQLMVTNIYAAGFTDQDILAMVEWMESGISYRSDEICAIFQQDILQTFS